MNKEQYLRNKGVLPKEDFGTLFEFEATRDGVSTIKEVLIWDIYNGEIIRSWTESGKLVKETIKTKEYHLRESPYTITIEEGNSIVEKHGYGSGFGDLWSWSQYASLSLEDLEKHRIKVEIDVKSKYGEKV